MAAVAAAAASTDEIVTQLRNEGVWAARKLARAQAEGQRLQSELGQAQNDAKRLTRALGVVQAQNEHQSLAVRTAHEAQVQAEKQLREAQGVNRSLKIELEVARRSLDRERARTVSTASSVAQLKAERDSLWDALAKASSTSRVEVEDVDAPMDGVESADDRVSSEPRPASFSPALSPPSSPALSISSSSVTSPPVAFRPPPIASPRISSPLASPSLVSPPLVSPPLVSPPSISPPFISPPLISPPLRSPPVFSPPRARASASPSQPPPTPPQHRPSPLTSASYVHRPSVTSSVPRPFLTPRSASQATPACSGSPHPPTFTRAPQTTPGPSAGSPHPPTLKRAPQTTPGPSAGSLHPPTLERAPRTTPASSSAGSPHPPTLKRKRSPPVQEVVVAHVFLRPRVFLGFHALVVLSCNVVALSCYSASVSGHCSFVEGRTIQQDRVKMLDPFERLGVAGLFGLRHEVAPDPLKPDGLVSLNTSGLWGHIIHFAAGTPLHPSH
ncbi:hypothetical protein C8R47DRAFT_114622 [Mycena vitilis]|nr:hypothetical protein C8R47DRAFT_114622 [Mycena vitilis]